MATRLTDGLWHIDCPTRDRPNAYVVEDGDDVTLVDAGWPSHEQTVRQGLSAAGYDPLDVDRVLLTHYDIDHVGSLHSLTPELDAPVYVHEIEAAYVRQTERPPLLARYGIEAFHQLLYRRNDPPDLPIRTIADGDTIGGFQALHTPGHSPGHLTYVHEDHSAAFLGDLVTSWDGGLKPTLWLANYDNAQLKASIQHVLDRTDSFQYACPGHGQPLADGYSELERALTAD